MVPLYRLDEVDAVPNQLSGKIGKTKEELVQTYQKLLPDDAKIQSKERNLHEKELENYLKSDTDSVFQFLINLIRNEGV